jgi:hypothetical protein
MRISPAFAEAASRRQGEAGIAEWKKPKDKKIMGRSRDREIMRHLGVRKTGYFQVARNSDRGSPAVNDLVIFIRLRRRPRAVPVDECGLRGSMIHLAKY